MFVVRERPPGLAGGVSGSNRRNWSSVKAWPEPKSPTSTRSAGVHMMASRQKTSCNAVRTPAISTSFQARHPLSNGLLEVINSSSGDLVPVFDAMLERAMRLCEDAFGAFFIREGEHLRAVATRGLSQRLDDFLR